MRTLNFRSLAIALTAVLAGAAIGIGAFTFIFAEGSSYLTNDPAACANCHVMRENFDAWAKSSHASVAVCNDCHTPHDAVGKYLTKALNGYNHSLAFTTGRFEEPIKIKQGSLDVVEDSCRHCHQDVVQMIDGPHREGDDRLSCVRCHPGVGH
jgi:cytochrome c nitrite reductase small subunit